MNPGKSAGLRTRPGEQLPSILSHRANLSKNRCHGGRAGGEGICRAGGAPSTPDAGGDGPPARGPVSDEDYRSLASGIDVQKAPPSEEALRQLAREFRPPILALRFWAAPKIGAASEALKTQLVSCAAGWRRSCFPAS